MTIQTALIADDHGVVRQAIRQILENEFKIDVVAEASHGLEAIAMVAAKQPDLVFLDIAMPYANGVEVLAEVNRLTPNARIIVLTGVASAALLENIWQTGISGLVSKSAESRDVRAAIAAALVGERFIGRDVEGLLARASDHGDLSRRQIEILLLVAKGHSNPEIASILEISPKTVDAHRTKLMSKLQVHSVAQLVLYAIREGLVDPQQL